MNRKQKTSGLTPFVAVMAIFAFVTFSAFYFQKPPWEAPKSADAKKNPLTSDAGTIAAGKAVFAKECVSCHGKTGKGDGPSAAQLETPPGNFTTGDTQGHSDGALFWKISEGRKPMPPFKKKLDENQIWQCVVYMRTFKK